MKSREAEIEFCKKCTKFLDWEIDDLGEDSCTYNTPFLVNISDTEDWETHADDFTNFLKADEMLFHCDWNWIMLVVQKMQQTEVELTERYRRGFLKDETTGQICFSVTYDARIGHKGWISLVSIELSPPYIYDSLDNKGRFATCLEATVTAIDNFLTWYENDKGNV